ncbi:MAG TPA: hypothetical protein VE966_08090 [Gemmatimonadales bacterium]|nr:hypothetical protein [Gemmatimonadales bacterium]
MLIKSCVLGSALLAATLGTTPASAEGLDVSLVQEPPRAAAPGPPEADAQSGARIDGGPSAAEGQPSKSIGIDLKIGGNGFRLGGRLSGSKGVSEAWVNGHVRGNGVTLDARLKGQDGAPRDFTLNLDLLPGWIGTAARLWLMLP